MKIDNYGFTRKVQTMNSIIQGRISELQSMLLPTDGNVNVISLKRTIEKVTQINGTTEKKKLLNAINDVNFAVLEECERLSRMSISSQSVVPNSANSVEKDEPAKVPMSDSDSNSVEPKSELEPEPKTETIAATVESTVSEVSEKSGVRTIPLDEVKKLKADGKTSREIGETLGFHRDSITKFCRKHSI